MGEGREFPMTEVRPCDACGGRLVIGGAEDGRGGMVGFYRVEVVAVGPTRDAGATVGLMFGMGMPPAIADAMMPAAFREGPPELACRLVLCAGCDETLLGPARQRAVAFGAKRGGR